MDQELWRLQRVPPNDVTRARRTSRIASEQLASQAAR